MARSFILLDQVEDLFDRLVFGLVVGVLRLVGLLPVMPCAAVRGVDVRTQCPILCPDQGVEDHLDAGLRVFPVELQVHCSLGLKTVIEKHSGTVYDHDRIMDSTVGQCSPPRPQPRAGTSTSSVPSGSYGMRQDN